MTWALIVAIFLSTVFSAVPKENQTKGEIPSVVSAEQSVALLLDAIQSGEPEKAAPFFFPKDAFNIVKDSSNPERYHSKLAKWYGEDILKEHLRFSSKKWTFSKFEIGRCKWKDIGTEGNKVAYWSCVGNFVSAVADGQTRRFEIRVLINWGDKWYVTHLGPIR
jgi:hypothetical protein